MKRVLFPLLAIILIGLGAASYYLYSTQGVASAGGRRSAAADQFWAERGGKAGADTSAGGPVRRFTGADGTVLPIVAGTVERIDGRKLTLKSPLDGAMTTVQLLPEAKVRQETEATLAELAPGTSVTVLGTKIGSSVDASLVRVGAELSAVSTGGAAPMIVEGKPGGAQMKIEAIKGTVEGIDGKTLTLRRDDGSAISALLSKQTQLRRVVDIDLDQIKVGDTVMATGERQGDLLEASELYLGGMQIRLPGLPAGN